ncbi:hypothetical protein TRVA0_003S00584 [Trichomonascus vanleenenianus]|uniref:uncharacterized protein n=1 Tax=Trichomonascus vanleenenianus TaxID=2268995 RepID=UPI003EC9E096
MAPGSLRSLSKALEGFFSSKDYSDLNAEVTNEISEFVASNTPIDPSDSAKLHEELVKIHDTSVADSKYEVPFVEALDSLAPCLTDIKYIRFWFGLYSVPALDSVGHLNTLVAASRKLLMKILLYEYDFIDEDSEDLYRELSSQVCEWILDIHLDIYKEWFTHIHESSTLNDEERRRFLRMNAKDLLMQFGMKRSKDFMIKLNGRFVDHRYRIQTLSLLSVFASMQPPFLYHIQQTDLLESLKKCLIYDLSSTALSIAATVLAMIMPHICDSLSSHLPTILAVYGRLACWRLLTGDDEVRDHEILEDEEDGPKDSDLELTEDAAPRPQKPPANNEGWDTLGFYSDLQDERKPSITPLFTFLYGLYPSNLLSFLRKPTRYLEKRGYKRPFTDFWDEYEILAFSKPIFELHMLHPGLVSNTAEEELKDNSRWGLLGSPMDIAAQCLALYNQSPQANANVSVAASKIPHEETPTLFDSDIPSYSYMYNKGDYSLAGSDDLNDGEHTQEQHPHIEESESRKSQELERSHPPDDKLTALSNKLLMSPSIENVDMLLEQHLMLYTKTRSDSLKDDDSHSIASSDNGLRQGDYASGPSRGRQRSGTISSPGFFQPSPGQAAAFAPSSTASSALAEERRSSVGQQSDHTLSEAPSSRRVSEHEADTSDKVEYSRQIEHMQQAVQFYQRELMIQKNELDFVSFIEQHSQYRYVKMRERLSKKVVNDESVRHLVSRNSILRKQIEHLRHELDTAQKNIKTYKRERQQYESNILAKNKEFRQTANLLLVEKQTLEKEVERLNHAREEIMQTMVAQEAKLAEMELKLAEALENAKYLDSYKNSLKAAEKKLAKYDLDNDTNDKSQQAMEAKVKLIQETLDDLELEYKSLETEKKQIESQLQNQVAELRTRLADYEGKPTEPTTQVKELIENFKAKTHAQYSELRTAYEDLTARYLELETRFRNHIAHDELLQYQGYPDDSAILSKPKKSILGYEIDEQHNAEVSSIHSEYSERYGGFTPLSPSLDPQVGLSSTPALPVLRKNRSSTEVRIKGRGGVQNISSTSNQKKSRQAAFRGLRM